MPPDMGFRLGSFDGRPSATRRAKKKKMVEIRNFGGNFERNEKF
jgi:hypothetical protein